MHLKIVLALAALASIPGVAEATIVNVNGLDSGGTTLTLAAGTYDVQFVQDVYTAWSPWSATSCSGSGPQQGCQGWTDRLDIHVGTDGTYQTYDTGAVAGVGSYWSTAEAALAAFEAAEAGGSLTVYQRGADQSVLGQSTTGMIQFTLTTPTAVKFVSDDSFYGDNRGGISLSLTQVSAAVPEPASWALFIGGFGMIGAAMRHRKTSVRFA